MYLVIFATRSKKNQKYQKEKTFCNFNLCFFLSEGFFQLERPSRWQNRHGYNPQQLIALITSMVLQNQQNNMSSCCFPWNQTWFADRQRAKLWNFLMISSKLVKACSNVLAQRIGMLIIS